MSKTSQSASAMRVAELAQNAATSFHLRPGPAEMATIADALDLGGLRKLNFEGEIRGHAESDWLLTGKLGATVTQPCGVTLTPVVTRLDIPVRRLFVRDFEIEDAPEVEMPEDDEMEPLGQWIDPHAIMVEALSLALPLYPRAPDVALGETVVTEPGVAPLTDEAVKPFAGLAALKDQLKDEDET